MSRVRVRLTRRRHARPGNPVTTRFPAHSHTRTHTRERRDGELTVCA